MLPPVQRESAALADHPTRRRQTPRILIVEDEFTVAAMMADLVRELGYAVAGPALTLAEARAALGRRDFDAVLLDIGLDGQRSPEIADWLMENGTPFAFVTGYDGAAEPRHAAVPVLHKPFTHEQLEALLPGLAGPPAAQDEPASKAG